MASVGRKGKQMELKERICKLACSMLVSDKDWEILSALQRQFSPNDATQSGLALDAAIIALSDYRCRVREHKWKDIEETIPTRQAIRPSDGGGRFYWRVLTRSDLGLETAHQTTKDNGVGGTKWTAARKAKELYVAGLNPVELIPPDIDPQGPDERQRSSAKSQPDGLAVHMRTKRH